MDISRAVDEFVSSGILLFYHLKAEGQGLSKLELHILAAQLQVLQIETTRLSDQQSPPLSAPPSALAPILRVFGLTNFTMRSERACSRKMLCG
jgi:hypothetical protein